MMELWEHNKELCTPRQKVSGWSIKSVPMGKTSSTQTTRWQGRGQDIYYVPISIFSNL